MTTEKTEEKAEKQEAVTTSTTKKKKAPEMIIQDDHAYGDTLRVIKFTSSEKPEEGEITVVATSPTSAARLAGVNSASLANVIMEDYTPGS